MADLLNKTIKIPEDILYQELSNGEVVFLNLDNESYYGLDNTGSIIWKELTGSENIEKAYNNLLVIFDVNPKELHNDLFNLIKELQNNGIITIS